MQVMLFFFIKLGFSYDDPKLESEIKESMHRANLDF